MAQAQQQFNEHDILMHGQQIAAEDTEKCPNCGANMTFNAETQMLSCGFCGSNIPFEMSRAEEQCFTKLFEVQNEWASEAAVIECSNCGAKTVISKDELAQRCAFCGTDKVVASGAQSGMKPNAIVPFKFTIEQAAVKAATWAKKKLFAPKAFKKCARPDDMKGLYSPAFTFSTLSRSRYHGRLGRRVTTTRRVNGRTVTSTSIRWFNVNGIFDRSFEELLIQSSATIGNKTMKKLGAYETRQSKAFQSNFLLGFSAEQYARDGKECWEDAKGQIEAQLRQEIIKRYNCDVVQFLNISTGYANIRHKYVLLPVYVGHFNYKAKLYNFFINGFSGKVFGKTPKHPVKVGLAAALGLAVLAGIGFLAWFMLS
jgi:ribosomal protein S27AE